MAKVQQQVVQSRNERRTFNEYGLTAKQELFVQEVAKGNGPIVHAYRIAYDVADPSAPHHYTAAAELMALPKIKDRLASLLKQQEREMMRDAIAIRKHVFEGLIKESGDMKSPATARIRALELLGKIDIVSMFKEIKEVEIHDIRKAPDIEDELRSKLRALMSPVHRQTTQQ